MTQTPLSRRRLLLLATAGTLAAPALVACTGNPAPVPPTVLPSPESPTPAATYDSDEQLRADVGQSELDLIASYTAAFAAHPKLAARYADIAAAHAEHLKLVTGHDAPQLSPLPLDRGTNSTRKWLAGLEAAAADQRAAAADNANQADLAGLLTLVAASEAQHEALLRTDASATPTPTASPA